MPSTAENPDYLTTQLITCIGNKRSLLGEIGAAVERVKQRLGKTRLRTLDAFAGSGVVSRLFKQHSEYLASNDLEDYAAVAGRCFLRNRASIDFGRLDEAVRFLTDGLERAGDEPGFFEDLYAPRDDGHITSVDRVFYTRDNARRLDRYRGLLNQVDADLRDLCLGPLLSEASVHANTAGVFKGYYKDARTGIGRFGGSHADALTRIKGAITPAAPILSRFECEVDVLQQDANEAVRVARNLDLAYFDPPYNQHPYGSNYFMLNLLVHYRRPATTSRVSGIPIDWNRSDYNVRARAVPRLRDLFCTVDSRFLLVSFNDEGFVSRVEMEALLAGMGRVEVVERPYNAFRGSRNLQNRRTHVTEHLFLVERAG